MVTLLKNCLLTWPKGETFLYSLIPCCDRMYQPCITIFFSDDILLDRLVDSQTIRRALDIVYSAYLPKNSHPFVYLRYTPLWFQLREFNGYISSIFIDSKNIDVNVHPTKREVHFLHEEAIVDSIQRAIEECLLGCNSSRTYYTQSLLPLISKLNPANSTQVKGTANDNHERTKLDYKLVRTDTKEKKLDFFVVPPCNENPASKQHAQQKVKKPVQLSSVLSLQSEIKRGRHTGERNVAFCVTGYPQS